ncbi:MULTISPECIES: acetyl-CoA carboxylase biotin carboxylase subunit family protein [unclassified Streptomyces]|uniref:ATP-grasp domain-containing protein n=1 Tax=unclassified Streptomyces TaxID=2593676 RepID=UPI001BED3C7C|nr:MULTISPECIES: ATP-grasp domain-containing protein [unclassified Streptomyces]MBT2402874.1 ATP-grasp domain-containing protein [Streptomyces sp. ISL-21]MBT2612020.1 ATP-grasp domain-containing protein [Streptomyces sp. ISL-87]
MTLESPPEAFILTGAFWVVCRNPRYLEELSARGLKILLITPESYREAAQSARKDPDHPASLIDEIAYVDGSLDQEGSFTPGFVAQARGWRGKYTVRGAYAVGETLVEQTGLLCDALGLRGPGLRATRVCRSKYLQRWYLEEFSPATLVVPPGGREDADLAVLAYPVVAKPATRHSSSGVVAVEDEAALRELLLGYPDHETLLIEQKVTGQEYSVESLVQHGEPVFTSVTRKETTESGAQTFVELAHSVPNASTEANGALLAANRRMLDALGFRDGIAHAEWRIGADGRPYLMEVAARTPGDGLLALYHLATGAPMEPEIVRIALGETASYPAPRRYTRQVYLEHEAGPLGDVTLDWPGVAPVWVGDGGMWPQTLPGAAEDPGALRALLVLKEAGAPLQPLTSSDDRAVTFLIDAPTPAELNALEQRVRAAVTLTTDPAAGDEH